MTHRAESILAAVTTLLTTPGLPTTGSNVVRDRVWSVDATVAASLSVEMGGEDPASEPNIQFQDEQLEVVIVSRVKAAQGSLATQLNKVAAEVYAALQASTNLGLAYVHRIRWAGRSRPQTEHEEKGVAMQEMRFTVNYRHSVTSTE